MEDCRHRAKHNKKITGARGRPVFDILKEQLEFLTEERFTAGEVTLTLFKTKIFAFATL